MNARKGILFTLIAAGLAFLCLFVNQGQAGDNLWTTTGPYGVRLLGLAIDPGNSQVIYAATPDGLVNVYKSVNGGTAWVPSSDGIPEEAWAEEFVFDPQSPNTLYVATERGVHKSLDAGASWEIKSTIEVGGELKIIKAPSIAISPVDGTLFVGSINDGFEAPGGIYRSRDGGEVWEHLVNGIPEMTVRAIAVAPSAPHIIYAGSYSDGQGVFKSTDGGDTWQDINNGFGLYPDVRSLTVDPGDSQVVYMGTDNGLYKTADGGQSWMAIGSGLGSSYIEQVVIDPNNQQIVYVATAAGVYRSLDNTGTSWAPMTDGMGSLHVYSLAINDSTPQTIYAGTVSGVWKYTLLAGPQDFSISINDGALFTNQTAVSLTLTAPSGTSEMLISNDGGFAGASWEPFTVQKPWTITAYDSYVIPRIVYAKFSTAGEISGVYQDDIILDVTAPTGSVEISDTLQIASDMASPPAIDIVTSLTDTLTNTVFLPLVSSNARLGFTMVHLLLSATDDVSGVSQMQVSNDAAFADAAWQAYASEMDWWVPQAATITVYVKFRDRAGNESLVYSDSMTP